MCRLSPKKRENCLPQSGQPCALFFWCTSRRCWLRLKARVKLPPHKAHTYMAYNRKQRISCRPRHSTLQYNGGVLQWHPHTDMLHSNQGLETTQAPQSGNCDGKDWPVQSNHYEDEYGENNKSDVECHETLGCLRLINPNMINHFAS